MLYDQATLLLAYSEAYSLSGENLFARTSEEIYTFLKGEMLSPDGFMPSIDADFNGEEGGYYVWDHADLRELLEDGEMGLLERCYGVGPEGNWDWNAMGFARP